MSEVVAQVTLGGKPTRGKEVGSSTGFFGVSRKRVRKFVADVHATVIVACWCLIVIAGIFSPCVIVPFLPHPAALTAVGILVLLAVWPLTDALVMAPARAICGLCVRAAVRYFPVEVHVEYADELHSGKPYVVGYEPHSVFPNGMPVVFSEYSRLLPAGLKGIKGLASSTCFHVPIIRQLWWGLGLRPATREVMSALLTEGTSVVVCPGGVRECCHLDHDREVIFLSQRYGFVRMALMHGAALVPAFCFGQAGTYSWVRPGPPLFSNAAVSWVASKLGFLPIYVYGYGYLPMPMRSRMRVVIGRAIPVPLVEDPSHELIEHYLQRFIASMADLYNRHRVAAGSRDRDLVIL